MTVKKPEGYIPAKKLLHDFGQPLYVISPYVSYKLVSAVLGTDSLEEERVREITEVLAASTYRQGSKTTLDALRDAIRREAGIEVSLQQLERFFGAEKVYILVKLRPQYPADQLTQELLGWDDVEGVDEVYGDADMVVTARMTYSKENVVARIRQRFAEAIEDIRVLVAD